MYSTSRSCSTSCNDHKAHTQNAHRTRLCLCICARLLTVSRVHCYRYDDMDSGAEVVCEVAPDVLDALPTPQNIRSEMLQLFEGLDPALQTALRLAAPMDAFSELMLTDVGLPSRIVTRLAHLFNMATDEGILESYARAIPQDVLAADPNAAHAWSWRMALMRQEVLSSLLASEVQRVEHKIADLINFHKMRQSTRQSGMHHHVRLKSVDTSFNKTYPTCILLES